MVVAACRGWRGVSNTKKGDTWLSPRVWNRIRQVLNKTVGLFTHNLSNDLALPGSCVEVYQDYLLPGAQSDLPAHKWH